MKPFILDVIKCFAFFTAALTISNLLVKDLFQIEWINSVFFPSGFMTVLLSLVHLLFMWTLNAGKNLSVHQSHILNGNLEPEFIMSQISRNTSWKLLSNSDKKIIYKIPISLKCWGEILTVNIFEDHTVLQSKPSLPTTLFDLGKNFQNIQIATSLLK